MFYSKPITLFTLDFLDYIIVLPSFEPCNRPNGWTEFFVVTHGSLGGETLKNQFSPRASSGPAASNK